MRIRIEHFPSSDSFTKIKPSVFESLAQLYFYCNALEIGLNNNHLPTRNTQSHHSCPILFDCNAQKITRFFYYGTPQHLFCYIDFQDHFLCAASGVWCLSDHWLD